MALSRARVVAGDAELSGRAQAIIAETLATPRDRAKVAVDILEMRELIEQEKPPRDIWDFKLIPGGLIDLEFLAQYLVLTSPDAAQAAVGTGLSTAERLAQLAPSRVGQEDLALLLSSLRLYTDLSQVIRLCIDGPVDPSTAPSGLIDLLCRTAGAADLKEMEADLRQRSRAVRSLFTACLRAAV